MEAATEWVEIGQRIREARLAIYLSQEDLAHQVGLDRTMIAKIESGRRRIDAMELMRLSAILGVPLGHFLYRRPAVVSRRAELDEDSTAAARQAYRLEAALLAWLRDVHQLLDAGVLTARTPSTYPRTVNSEDAARDAARWVRRELGLGDAPIPSLVEICERSGQFVLVTDVPGEGASLVDGDVAVAVVSRQGDPGRRRTTAAHELGHLVLGDEYSSDLGVHLSRHDREAAVETFAAELLLPATVVEAERRGSGGLTRESLVRLAATYRTSWSLAVRQGVHHGAVDPTTGRSWRQVNPTRTELMDAVGWAPQPDLDSVRVPPSVAHAVMTALRQRLITPARALELMHGQIEEADLPPYDERELAP